MLSAAVLPGPEAAWQLAQAGVPVVLHEMRPLRGGRGPQNRWLCRSSSAQIRSAQMTASTMQSASCMKKCAGWAGSSCGAGDENQVPAGGALAVDRDGFLGRGDGGAPEHIH